MTNSRMPDWRRFLRFWGRNVDADVSDELTYHIERRTEELVARGVPRDEARRRVLERFGNLDAARRECADIDRGVERAESRRSMLLGLQQDIAFALRIFSRQKLPAAIIVLCLALGIGATTTVFSVGDALLLRPLPYPNGSRLVDIATRSAGGSTTGVSSLEDFLDWEAGQRSFEAMAEFRRSSLVFAGASEAVRVTGASTTAGLFRALGVHALRGRVFRDGDDLRGAAPVAVVSESFTRQRLGGLDSAVGKSIVLSGTSYVVVGVVADGDRFPDGNDTWVPLVRDPHPGSRNSRSYEMVAALKPGTSFEAARADLAAVSAAVTRANPVTDGGTSAVMTPLRDRYVATSRPAFLALVCAAFLLLAIACANVAALQLARASSRAREIAVRTALGAARRRVIRQLLTESVLLATVGGALGVALTFAASGVVMQAIPAHLAAWMAPSIDWRVLAFCLVVSMLSGIAFGMAPAFRLAGVAPAGALRGRSGLDSRGMTVQRGLVVSEVALALVLLVGATLAVQSVRRLTTLDPGFSARNVLTLRLALQGPRYENARDRVALIEQFDQRLKAIPGVEAAGGASHMPIADCCSQFGFHRPGEPTNTPGHMVTGNVVTPGFFAALNIGLVQGRYLTDADRNGVPQVIVVNETFANDFMHDPHPVGKTVGLGSSPVTIVGVVRDVKQRSFTDPPEPQFYAANAQMAWDVMTFALRVRDGMEGDVVRAARAAMRDLDPSLPLYRALPLTELLDRAMTSQRMFGMLLGGFAVMALALATAGIYGVASYYVAQRTAEMGIRMALGAKPSQVVAHVVRQGAGLAALGVVVGFGGALLTARALTRVLWGVTAGEPGTYLLGAGLIAATAILACAGPAFRAGRVDPIRALRAE